MIVSIDLRLPPPLAFHLQLKPRMRLQKPDQLVFGHQGHCHRLAENVRVGNLIAVFEEFHDPIKGTLAIFLPQRRAYRLDGIRRKERELVAELLGVLQLVL